MIWTVGIGVLVLVLISTLKVFVMGPKLRASYARMDDRSLVELNTRVRMLMRTLRWSRWLIPFALTLGIILLKPAMQQEKVVLRALVIAVFGLVVVGIICREFETQSTAELGFRKLKTIDSRNPTV